MQSMARNGTPGDVQILAKSSTEDGINYGDPSLLNGLDSSASPSDAMMKVIFIIKINNMFNPDVRRITTTNSNG
jgi:hypothetical protein